MESRIREVLIDATKGREAPSVVVADIVKRRRRVWLPLRSTYLVAGVLLLVPVSIFAASPKKLLLTPKEAASITGQTTIPTGTQGPVIDTRPVELGALGGRVITIGYLPPGFSEGIPRASETEVVRFFQSSRDAFITLRQEDAAVMSIAVSEYEWQRPLLGPAGTDSAVLHVLKHSEDLLRIRWAVPRADGGWRNFELISRRVSESELIRVFRSIINP